MQVQKLSMPPEYNTYRENDLSGGAMMRANRKINFSKDCYGILGIPQDASFEQIKKSYRKKILKYHPDRHYQNGINRQTAHKMAIELNEAYQILIDKDSREEYDAGYSQAQDELRRAAEEERIREEEERRREYEERIRAEEQCKREEEERIRAEEQRRRDEQAERERIRLERERRIVEEQRKKSEQLRMRMEEYEIGMAISVFCSIISGVYSMIMMGYIWETTIIKSALCSIALSAVLISLDYLLYSKMRSSGESVPYSLWIWGWLDEPGKCIYMPTTFATFFVAFFVYYPIIACLLIAGLCISGVGIPAIIIVPVGYIGFLLYHTCVIPLSMILPVENLYFDTCFHSN
jgi:hypothetical protein